MKRAGLGFFGLCLPASSMLSERKGSDGNAFGASPSSLGEKEPFLEIVSPTPSSGLSQGTEGKEKTIALTFDDGPTPGSTENLLEELALCGIYATFFMIGERVRKYPSLAREVVAAGHEVGNHTYHHRELTKLFSKRVDEEIEKCQEEIFSATGSLPIWLRPPYGSAHRRERLIARKRNLGTVLWTVDSCDWERPGVEKIIENVVGSTKSRSIILMHDLNFQTKEALTSILEKLMDKGFVFLTVSEMLLPRPS